MSGAGPPPDQPQRDLILSELGSCMLVEAAAGTGKTESIVGRMTALLAMGECADVRAMAAVTFTRKAAAELRSRFQIALERSIREAAGEERERLSRALDNIEQCFVGTIHSFCGRLLRERPVEAKIDLAFEEIDEETDAVLRREVWREYCANVIAGGTEEKLSELERYGIALADLQQAFDSYTRYPDVDLWPVPEPDDALDVLEDAAGELEILAAHMSSLWGRLPRAWGNDELIRKYRTVPRVVSHYDDIHDPRQLAEILEGQFARRVKQVQSDWMKEGNFTREEAKEEKRLFDEFQENVAAPALRAWRELRYGPILNVLEDARLYFDQRRAELARLNFQDLLMKAAALLRDNPHVRRYFRDRYTHVLVDEFQDTDPIQAEVLLLLTATDTGETDWRKTRPRPGSLFVVGDPKQSIYRFRRADVVTYNEVKRVILHGGTGDARGMLVELTANFRAVEPVIDWVNHVFEPDEGTPTFDGNGVMLRFPGAESDESPAYEALRRGRLDGSVGTLTGVMRLPIGDEAGNKDSAVEYEAGLIARFIRSAISDGSDQTVSRTAGQLEDGLPEAAGASDFMIITRATENLSAYAAKLQELGIPHQVTGGTTLNEVEELELLRSCLTAVSRPDDPVALVAALRSGLFGLSDVALFRFKLAGGRFNYNTEVPDSLEVPEAEAFTDTFSKLRRCHRWLATLPVASAVENIAADLGLMALAGSRPGGDVQAGSLGKAVELIRGLRQEAWSVAQVVAFLDGVLDPETTQKYDGVSACSRETPAVRVMNLHKVKGLEAPVVFLANPYGYSEHDVQLFIDRQGEKVLGYMAIYAKKRTRRSRTMLIAQPVGWEELAGRARAFEVAEELRLRYVAATRAGSALIITERSTTKNTFNAWKNFAPHLASELAIEDPGPQKAPERETITVSAGDAAAALAAIESRLADAVAPTYESWRAKEYALATAASTDGPGWEFQQDRVVARETEEPPEGESGVEWGQAIHQLLELAMRQPHADVEAWAGAVLAENGIDSSRSGEAAETVASVMGSDIWRRARGSARCLTEVPFTMTIQGTDPPTLVRGAIDLVFEEDGGWVLVDYKTDRVPDSGGVEALAARYAPQLDLYVLAWERGSGEVVKESGLYLTRERKFVVVRKAPSA